ncbi:LacI family DNA-binding transcriptional regulator [Enterococcus casseliflavus]|nr:LacI family DNA-binding transcriptional regulator [Enterococcus casseliflavus]
MCENRWIVCYYRRKRFNRRGNGKYQDVAKLANGSVNTVLRVINKKIHE